MKSSCGMGILPMNDCSWASLRDADATTTLFSGQSLMHLRRTQVHENQSWQEHLAPGQGCSRARCPCHVHSIFGAGRYRLVHEGQRKRPIGEAARERLRDAHHAEGFDGDFEDQVPAVGCIRQRDAQRCQNIFRQFNIGPRPAG